MTLKIAKFKTGDLNHFKKFWVLGQVRYENAVIVAYKMNKSSNFKF